jgi:antitoxin component HigA of HigAB toxin-antitoxin module
MFDLQIIRDDATHEAALAEAERLMDMPNRSEADTKRLELLGFLISRYEEETLLGADMSAKGDRSDFSD